MYNTIVSTFREKKEKMFFKKTPEGLMDVRPNLCCSRINFMKLITEQSVLKYDESCKLIWSEQSYRAESSLSL